MTELIWDESRAVGYAEIDEQHKKLFDVFNDLCRSMQTSQEWPAVKKAIDDLVAYAATHFKSEEAVMDRFGYPEKAMHVGEHRAFMEKLARFEFGKIMHDPALANDIFMFLADWIVEHTSTLDVRLGEHIRFKQATA